MKDVIRSWGNDGAVKVVTFVSRNKDNSHIKVFKQRSRAFITDKTPSEINEEFKEFVSKGLTGELSRFYVSVNDRNLNRTKRELLINLIDSENNNDLLHMSGKLASIAMQSKNAASKKWMLDVDTFDKTVLGDALEYILDKGAEVDFMIETINGYHIITNRGFDTRELLKKHPEITLNRDGMYLINWAKKEEKPEINRDTFKEYVEFIQDIKARHLDDREACPINYGTLCDILIKGYKMLTDNEN